MDLTYSAADERFREEVRDWLETHLTGDFAGLRGLGGPGREHEAFEERLAWDRHLGAHGWTCLGWPAEHGGRDLDLLRQIVFHEEYARANAPARVNHLGEELLGPTLIALGTEEQKTRFLPAIAAVEELWCQGYSEPGAGSDLASVSTRARLEGDEWVVDGQKTWTSLAQYADWCFVVARTVPGSKRHAGLSYLLVPMRRKGVVIRPILQLTGTSDFNEVYFDGARTEASLVVGEPGDGWKVAMATLGFERGISTIGQQAAFARELEAITGLARRNGTIDDPLIQDRIAHARMGLDLLRLHALRTLAGRGPESQGPAQASVSKLVWATWHRSLGELAMQVAGAGSLLVEGAPYELDEFQRLFLYTRADTIYGGSNEIQRNILAERVLGLPREARP
ncbi:acyl-CoA dehydrogenase family protein [Actinocorallia populi]|uniref:acyl-CoA dehydrogenase family protein n=1 Tax=Actinocorallia populi TaxID=2079200 RepID=UPI000D096196|nr:acyl-CoA dehydrogenase family protein [Actinocorallia populi]